MVTSFLVVCCLVIGLTKSFHLVQIHVLHLFLVDFVFLATMSNQQFQPILILVVFMFIMLQSMVGNVGDEERRELEKSTLSSFHKDITTAYSELSTRDWAQGYGNVTGFRRSYADFMAGKNELDWSGGWMNNQNYLIIPDAVRDKIELVWNPSTKPSDDTTSYLLLLSGRAHGVFDLENAKGVSFIVPNYIQEYVDSDARQKWEDQKQRYEDDPMNNEPPPEWSELIDQEKTGNFSASNGALRLRFAEKQPDETKEDGDVVSQPKPIYAHITVSSNDESERHEFSTNGIYFPHNGLVVTVTNTAKFYGPYALPHLVPEDLFGRTKSLMTKTLNNSTPNVDELMDFATNTTQSCEAIAYFKLKKTNFSREELQLIDSELKDPTGRPIPSYNDLPKVEVDNFIVYSPDCGKIFTRLPKSTKVQGLLDAVLTINVKRALTAVLFLAFVQLWLLLRQKRFLRTPGELSAVLLHTVLMIAIQDSTVDIMLLMIAPNLGDTMGLGVFLLCASIIMILLLKCLVFETMFTMQIVNLQWSERESTWWSLLRGAGSENNGTNGTNGTTTTNGNNGTTTTNGNNGTTTNGGTNTQPVSIDDDSWFLFVFGSGFLMSLVLTFIFLSVTGMRKPYRYTAEYIGFLAVNTMWIPQFLRNTLKNRRTVFTWEYILGTSVIRIVPIAYVCLCLRNPLRHRFDPMLLVTVTAWLLMQIGLLYLQSRLGARFWLNERWLPKTYDYHPVIMIGDLERGGYGNLGSDIQSSNEVDGVVECKLTCLICMADVEVPIVAVKVHKVDTKGYMVTPCRHVFHLECLESWMRYKLQCPVCREELPPK